MAATTATLSSIHGTPVLLYPLPTTFETPEDCSTYIYRQANEGSIIAWDPFYGSTLDTDERSCWPSQASSWWFQSSDAATSTAVGPSFVCPDAYSAVQTVVDQETQAVYCCPSDYSLNKLQPSTLGFPSQCISEVAPGESVSFLSLFIMSGSTSLTTTATTVAEDDETVTVFAVPINGFNIDETSNATSGEAAETTDGADATQDSTLSSPATASAASGDDDKSSGTPIGVTVGISLGVVFAALAIAIGGWLWWRRRRRAMQNMNNGHNPGAMGDVPQYVPQGNLPPEMVHSPKSELPVTGRMHPGETVYEMPGHSTYDELPGYGR